MSLPPLGLSWFRSSTCADHSCIEVAADDDHIYVRDGEDGAVLRFTRDEWVAFRDGVKLGDFDAI
jgi:hypothetical protein